MQEKRGWPREHDAPLAVSALTDPLANIPLSSPSPLQHRPPRARTPNIRICSKWRATVSQYNRYVTTYCRIKGYGIRVLLGVRRKCYENVTH